MDRVGMGKSFKNKVCVYCGTQAAATDDHVFARQFFLETRRANLPKAPACEACNNAKSRLEHYLTAVLPFGGRHADGMDHLRTMVPKRLEKNQALARTLRQGQAYIEVPDRGSLAMSVPIDPEKVQELVGLIAKGLIWHHWRVVLTPAATGVRAGALSDIGVKLHQQWLAMNCRDRVSGNLGNGTFTYEGAQSAENPEVTVWTIAMFGGIQLGDDEALPGEITSLMGAITASHALLARIREIEAPQTGGREAPEI
jgi:hypothetical protein